MRAKRIAVAMLLLAVVAAMAVAIARSQLPAIGAGALLYPARQFSVRTTPPGCIEKIFEGLDARLAGWVCRTALPSSKPVVVYLHGIGDNRDTSTGVIERFLRRGFNVVVYDSRGHGRSEGEQCTYGFFEKQDLRRVLVQAGVDRAIVIGHSLGGAVALQAAAIDLRIVGVVAVSTFADLRSIATERAPFVFTPALIDAAFARAERDARFVVDDASPLKAASKISAPVFIIHGALDEGTRAAHSERVYAALRQPKRLWIVPDAGHNDVLRSSAVWQQIEDWIDALI